MATQPLELEAAQGVSLEAGKLSSIMFSGTADTFIPLGVFEPIFDWHFAVTAPEKAAHHAK